jgi:hypothetical protein
MGNSDLVLPGADGLCSGSIKLRRYVFGLREGCPLISAHSAPAGNVGGNYGRPMTLIRALALAQKPRPTRVQVHRSKIFPLMSAQHHQRTSIGRRAMAVDRGQSGHTLRVTDSDPARAKLPQSFQKGMMHCRRARTKRDPHGGGRRGRADGRCLEISRVRSFASQHLDRASARLKITTRRLQSEKQV